MQDLANKVWSNPAFHLAAARMQRAWIARDIRLQGLDPLDLGEAARVMRAAAILACSHDRRHREMAYRAATATFELHGSDRLPFDQAVRVVLSRLGNFPAMQTRQQVATALPNLPLGMIAEEVADSAGRLLTVRGRDYVLTDFQRELLRRLRGNQRLALAAPTSAGKSFVLQAFLASLFEADTPRSVVYLVPTRALIAQVSRDLRELMAAQNAIADPAEIVTVPLEAGAVLARRCIYVMTQERLQATMSAHPGFTANVVIVDEAQAIAEGARGVLLQWVVEDLLKRAPRAQLLFASPGVRNLDLFGRTFDLRDIETLPSRELTVAQNFLAVTIEDPRRGVARVNILAPQSPPVTLAQVCFAQRTVNRIEKLVNVAAHFGAGASNIVYANGPADAEAIAIGLARRFRDRETTPARNALAKLAAESVHGSYALVACVQRGIAYHYAHMPTQVRQAVEAAMRAGDIDYLVCTSTLLQGVNLPAKNVFMFRPEKGANRPLVSVDFWNLAGRAGRLLKEFQGNIFLIDYDRWAQQPLGQTREARIVPALERAVVERRAELLEAIRRPRSSTPMMEATFVRLLDAHAEGTLSEAVARLYGEEANAMNGAGSVIEAIGSAARQISLPQGVIRRSPTISAHKQQALYQRLLARARVSRRAALQLLPRHPREGGAYESYSAILQTCLMIIAGRGPDSRYHRFLAFLALRWMRGDSLPRIIQNRIDRQPRDDRRLVVRKTLELVEREVRYNCVRMFACYNAVLAQVYDDLSMTESLKRLPPVPLFLEVGASDRTTINLMALGLSRVAALRLTLVAPGRNLDIGALLVWLREGDWASARLSPLLAGEVEEILRGLGNVLPLR